MGLIIVLTKQPDREWFTSFDDVCGTVIFTNKRHANVKRIVVYLEGILKISLRPVNASQDCAYGNSTRFLFSRQAILFDSYNSTGRESGKLLDPGAHTFAFHLDIPLLTSCPSSQSDGSASYDQSALPPSFDLTSDVLKASATYRIRTVVERCGVLKRRLSTARDIEFRPLHPPELRLAQQPKRTRVVEHLDGSALGFRNSNTNVDNDLPPYSPSIGFETTLPYSRSIRPGTHVDLAISIRVPEELRQAQNPIWLESLNIRLRTTTTGIVPRFARSHVGYINICAVQGHLPLEIPAGRNKFMLPPELWQSHVYPSILPSFRSCGIQRIHRLEVIAGFASRLMDHTQFVAMEIDVTVESTAIASSEAPPDYEP